jgi:hypothetical protein
MVITSFTGADFNRERLRAATRQVRAHEAFPVALAQFCALVPSSFAAGAAANRLMGQAGRFAMMSLVIALGARHRDGLDPEPVTVARLARILGRRRLASRNRTYAMAAFLHDTGAIAIDGGSGVGDLRMRPVKPTELLIRQAASWLANSLPPVALVTQLPAPAEQLAAEQSFVERFLQDMIAPYLAAGFILYDDFSDMEAVMQRTGGYALMIELLRAASNGDPNASMPSTAELANRLHISRSQVRHVMTTGQKRGWLARASQDKPALTPAFTESLSLWVAAELAWGGDLARRAASSVGRW